MLRTSVGVDSGLEASDHLSTTSVFYSVLHAIYDVPHVTQANSSKNMWYWPLKMIRILRGTH